jgi:elongation factor Ts
VAQVDLNAQPTIAGEYDDGSLKPLHSHGNDPPGIVASYIHPAGRIGALIELRCETDFVARTAEFHTLAREIVMQVAAMSARIVGSMDSPDPNSGALLDQEYIRDSGKTVRDLIQETIVTVGESIWVERFVRFEVGTS